MEAPPPLLLPFLLLLFLLASNMATAAGDGCSAGCDLALGSYYVTKNTNITYIASLFGFTDYQLLAKYNPGLPNLDDVAAGYRVDVPFPCECLARPSDPASTYLAASIPYKVAAEDTYITIAHKYNNLTTAGWLQATNTYPTNNSPDVVVVNVTVNCSCGDAGISADYGLFRTFPLRDWETLASVAATRDFSSPEQLDQLRRYNPGMDGVTGSGLVYIPAQDPDGSYLPLKSPAGTGKKVSAGAIAGSVVAGVVAPVLGILLFLFYRQRKAQQNALLPSSKESTRLGNNNFCMDL